MDLTPQSDPQSRGDQACCIERHGPESNNKDEESTILL